MALRNYLALRQYQIHSVHPTGRTLGNGAYGKVLEAKIPGAVCAVKKMHGILEREVRGWVDQDMIAENRRKFVQECELMSRLRHPHIVQFLGVCEFPGSDTPALVTELLLTDLHSLLLPRGRQAAKPYIPLGFKYSILRDVARGLVFLHSQSPPIIHRDLTATNVLLNSAMVAKIADLGVARLIPEAAIPLTKGPGNAAYMPPEAQGVAYNESLDVFSFGVLCLFTLTQTFPQPHPIKYQENGQTLSRTEAQRRSTFLEQLSDAMKEQVEQCLHDNPENRPSAQEMLSLLETTASGTSEEFMKQNVLELAQTIEREREENALQRTQDEREFQLVVREKERAFQLTITENEREFGRLIEEKEKECQLEKEKGLAEVITHMQQEKQEAVQQKEREIVEELTGFLGGGAESCGGVTGVEGKDEILNTAKQQSRAVMIIGSITPPTSPGIWPSLFLKKEPLVIPQEKMDLSEDDVQVLSELDLPQEQWSNLDALMALYNKTENYDVLSVQVSRPGMELSRSYILEQIEFLLKNSAKKTHEVVLHYYGNSRSGDWCFRDGFITFRDIADLYMKHSRGRILTIVPDCHSSGRWVSECAKFLDEQGVKPCGHSARKKGILLKIYASCRTGQDSAELAYTTRAMELREDGHVYHYRSNYLGGQQRTFGFDFTAMRCGKAKEADECSIDATWSTAQEIIKYPHLEVNQGVGISEQQQQQQLKDVERKIKILNQERIAPSIIIGSITQPSSTGNKPSLVIPQTPADLSEKDRQVLKNLSISPDKWNNLNALWALYNKMDCGVFSIQVSRPGMELSRSYILEQIKFLLIKAGAVVLHYYGNGRRNTGDWCFRDGFITFRDIADLYMKHSRGRVLNIISDCHSSGRWVSECAKFLDEQGVKPCGHSAREKGILLRIIASCKAGQNSAELAYTIQAIFVDKSGIHYTGKQLCAHQQAFGFDFTAMMCGKKQKEKCSVASDSTWSKTLSSEL